MNRRKAYDILFFVLILMLGLSAIKIAGILKKLKEQTQQNLHYEESYISEHDALEPNTLVDPNEYNLKEKQ
jgi:hypothetical protein